MPAPETKLIKPKTLLRKVRTALFDVSQETSAMVREQLGPITCGAGCGGCCAQKVIISAAEGVVLYLHLKAEGRWNEALRSKLVDLEARMSKTSHARWLPQAVPCAMQDDQGWCTAYTARPVACAVTYAVHGKPELCVQVGVKGQFTVTKVTPAMKVWGATIEGLNKGLTDTVHPDYFTLPGAVLWGHAKIEGLPEPQVRRERGDDHADHGGVTEAFDAGLPG